MILERRKFLTGLGAVIVAAQAIVHAKNLMPVRALQNRGLVGHLGGIPIYQVDVLYGCLGTANIFIDLHIAQRDAIRQLATSYKLMQVTEPSHIS